MIATRRIRPPPRAPIPLEALTPGHVAMRGSRAGIVAAAAHGRVLLWPVCWRAGERAAEVPVTDWADRLALGNPRAALEPVIVQADILLDVPHAGLCRRGRIGADLLARIELAAARGARTRELTSRWQGDRGHRRNGGPPGVRL